MWSRPALTFGRARLSASRCTPFARKAGGDLIAPPYSIQGMDPRPAVAGITGTGREWTVWMISELSIPCR
jgi:hypothetical protein